MDSEKLAFVSAIGSIVSMVIGAFVKTLADNWIKTRRASAQICAEEDDRVIKGYELAISKLDARVAVLETELRASRQEHMECVRAHERNVLEIQRLQREIDDIRAGRE